MTVGDSLRQPLITGSVSLIDGQLLRGPSVSAGVTFRGRNGSIDYVHLGGDSYFHSIIDTLIPSLDFSARGNIDFPTLDEITLRIAPTTPVLASSQELTTNDCVSTVEFQPVRGMIPSQPDQEIELGGSLLTRSFALSVPSLAGVEVFPLCNDNTSGGKPLLLILPWR
jgi:hypothetical protein